VRAFAAIGLALAAYGLMGSGAQGAPPSPTGMWVTESGRAAVDIEACDDKLCGAIAWMKEPLNEQGKPKTDIHNSDESQHARPLCGLKLLWGFSPEGDGSWSGGQIYDPATGDTYSSNFHVQPDGSLRVRGYLGISLFGKSQVWTRPPAALPHC
jgi:uncharacterized protein (DUF2147 family)